MKSSWNEMICKEIYSLTKSLFKNFTAFNGFDFFLDLFVILREMMDSFGVWIPDKFGFMLGVSASKYRPVSGVDFRWFILGSLRSLSGSVP